MLPAAFNDAADVLLRRAVGEERDVIEYDRILGDFLLGRHGGELPVGLAEPQRLLVPVEIADCCGLSDSSRTVDIDRPSGLTRFAQTLIYTVYFYVSLKAHKERPSPSAARRTDSAAHSARSRPGIFILPHPGKKQHKSDHCGIKRGGWNKQQTSRSRRQRLTPAAEPVRGRSSRKAAAPPVLSAGTGQS